MGEHVIFELMVTNTGVVPLRLAASRDWTLTPATDCRLRAGVVENSFLIATAPSNSAAERRTPSALIGGAFLIGSDDVAASVLTLAPHETLRVRASDLLSGNEWGPLLVDDPQTLRFFGFVSVEDREHGWLSEVSDNSRTVAVSRRWLGKTKP